MTTNTALRSSATAFSEEDRRYQLYRPARSYGRKRTSKRWVWIVWTKTGEVQAQEVSNKLDPQKEEGFDLKKTEEDLDRWGDSQGIDLAQLLQAAGAHFQSDRDCTSCQ